jgi:hypothetical protein
MSVLTFEQFLRTPAAEWDAINTLFEERLFDLVGVLHKISRVLSEESILYELIGGLAVLVHVEEANPEHTTLTRWLPLPAHGGRRHAALRRYQQREECGSPDLQWRKGEAQPGRAESADSAGEEADSRRRSDGDPSRGPPNV